MNYAVSTSKLCKSYDNSLIVKDCAIRVRKGSIYGLLGANGAGKTTIFKMLSGLISPTSGDAEILGLNVVTSRVEIQKNIGIVIDVPVFYENLSATENIKLHLSYMGKKADVKKTLETVGLDDTGKRPVAKLSLGMRQRLAIARAIVHQPELLILDEPTNGLDPIGIRQMRELFVFLVKERGISIIISSHILTEIQHVCDNIGMIAKG
ncbi:MAG: ATP-binding cassette domain-containing protein, partial [Oscillospiraceae bacterium]|nr:ATP-binding cassette domain-containing protein [Oscillospiraceae bacterium]